MDDAQVGQDTTDNMPTLPTTISWVPCASCRREFSKLFEDGFCWDCHAEKVSEESILKAKKEKLVKVFSEKGSTFTLENFTQTPENEKALRIAEQFNPARQNLYLHGSVGSGKTHLAYAIARKFFDLGKSVGIWKQPGLMREFRGKNTAEELAALAKVSSVDVLIIDDLGVGRTTEFSLQVLYEIVDSRDMESKNGLIITSNASLDEIAARMEDSRLADRIAGICKVVQLSATKSWRLVKRG